MTRRQALRTAGAAGIYLGTANAFGRPADPSGAKRKIKLGIVGCGGRGGWLAKLFKEHGGYEIHAVADYFQRVADKCGDEVGVNSKRRFSGLSGHRKLIESGVEAIALETPPYPSPSDSLAATMRRARSLRWGQIDENLSLSSTSLFIPRENNIEKTLVKLIY